MKKMKKIISIIMIAAMIASLTVLSTVTTGASSTGVGLCEWVFNAYYDNWSYVWGGAEPGAVDCSGLIWSYCGGDRTSMLSDAQANGRDWGYVSDGIPNVHGLGLSRPGHVGVYVGNGMEIDARGTGYDMCYDPVGSSWECWFKLTAVSYPDTGWVQLNGTSYYYENGEYVADTSRTINGTTYYFDASGACSTTPSDTSSATTEKPAKTTTTKPATTEDNGPLKNGSQGERVEKLQARLQELGYYNGLVDGDFGDLTEKAFKLFQKQAGLYVDGIAGSDVDYLYADDAPIYSASTDTDTDKDDKSDDLAETGANNDPEEEDTEDPEEPEEDAEEPAPAEDETEKAQDDVYFSAGDYDDAIVPIQERLIDLGYLNDTADGGYGDNTETAVKSFQTVNQLEVTGAVDQVTYDVLFSDDAIKNPDEKKTTEAPVEESTTTPEQLATTAAESTEIEKTNSAISQKSVSGITDSISLKRTTATTNLEFILWLAIMIAVMLVAFIIVYVVEKKKKSAVRASIGTRFQ